MTNPNSLKNLRPYQPGQSGNPQGINAGRPARVRLTEAFVGDFAKSLAAEGPKVLSTLARTQPAVYAGLAAKLVPAEVAVSLEARSSVLDDADLAILRAIKAGIPDANSRDPGEVMNYVLDAIRSYGAKPVIEG